MKTTPDENWDGRRTAADATHVEINTDIAIWDESSTPGLRARPAHAKNGCRDTSRPGHQLSAAKKADD